MFLVEIGLCSSKLEIVLKMLAITMKPSVVDKNTPEYITFATFHHCRLACLKCCM